jgi:hypothetical protein
MDDSEGSSRHSTAATRRQQQQQQQYEESGLNSEDVPSWARGSRDAEDGTDDRTAKKNNTEYAPNAAVSGGSSLISMLLAGQLPVLQATQNRLLDLIRSAGPTGILSCELPKRFESRYGKKLDMELDPSERAKLAANGDGRTSLLKVKMKDLMISVPGISLSGLQLIYVYDAQQAEADREISDDR